MRAFGGTLSLLTSKTTEKLRLELLGASASLTWSYGSFQIAPKLHRMPHATLVA